MWFSRTAIQLLAEHIGDVERRSKLSRNNWECKKLKIDLDESSGVSVREQLATALREQSGIVANFFRQLDTDETGYISKEEFCRGLRQELGCELAQADLEAVFHEFDPDDSGHVEYHEMQQALCSKRAAAAAAAAAKQEQVEAHEQNGDKDGSPQQGPGATGHSADTDSEATLERDMLLRALAMKDLSGWSAVHAAAANGHDKVLRLLIEYGINLDVRTHSQLTPLCLAVSRGHAETITLLADAGAAVEAWDAQLGKTSLGQIPLHIATVNAQAEVVKHLLLAKANLEARDQSGSTALHVASARGMKNLVILLVGAKADLNAQNAQQRTAVHLAAARGEASVITVLARSKAALDRVDTAGRHAVHLAAEHGHVEAVRTLAELGSPLTGRDFAGETPLHLAAAKAYIEVARELTKAGVPFESKSNVSQVRLMLKLGELAAGPEVMEEWLDRLEVAARAPANSKHTPRRSKVQRSAAPTIAQKLAKAGRRLVKRVREGYALAPADLLQLQDLAFAEQAADDGAATAVSDVESESGSEPEATQEAAVPQSKRGPDKPRPKRVARAQQAGGRVRPNQGISGSPWHLGGDGVSDGVYSEIRPTPPAAPRHNQAPSPREGALKTPAITPSSSSESPMVASQCTNKSTTHRHTQRQWDSAAQLPLANALVDPRQLFASSRPRLPKTELLNKAYPGMSPRSQSSQPLSARASKRRTKPDPEQLPPIRMPHTHR